ncbi:MAG: hypothetical protein LBN38_04815 [Verrucomicrobiota bacterium]|jgi:hypothetical protein|nr:hypothetical protein [Verrucomicrobiota bacterium]
MKTLHAFSCSLSFLTLLCLAGCATVEKRIEKNRDYFDSLPVAAQARIRGGQIDIGFTPPMVRIALGDPDRRLMRRSAGNETEIWLYLDTEQRYVRQRADIDGLSVAGAGGIRVAGGSAWINVLQEREYIRSRVEFQHGRVVLIEEAAAGTPPAEPTAAPQAPPAGTTPPPDVPGHLISP